MPDNRDGSEDKKNSGEAAGRQRGEQAGGGRAGNDPLESGQLRGVDEDELINSGTHGGPQGHGHSSSNGKPEGNRSRKGRGTPEG
jgi:hypothetical protein